MTSPKRMLALAVLFVIIALAVAIWLRFEEKGRAAVLTLYGNVDIREVDLAFRVPGRLLRMHFEEGDPVEAGELVAEIDPQPYRDALAAADARYRQAEANLAKLKSGSRPQEVASARAAVRQAEAAFVNAESNLQRQSGLLESGASSVKVLDAAHAQRDETAAKLESAKQSLALVEEGFRAEDISAAEADLAAAAAQRSISETQLNDCMLLAPSRGVLTTRILEPGSMLTAGMPVYSLSLRDPVYLRAYVDETQLGRLAPGMKVSVTTDSTDKVYQGQIGFISPRAEFTPRSVETTALRTDLVYRLRIIVSNADEGLRQGMPVTVSVPLNKTPE